MTWCAFPVLVLIADKKTGYQPVCFDFSRKLRYFVQRCSPEPELNRKKNAGKHGLLPEGQILKKSMTVSGKIRIIVS
jgi:hypothetical protein